MFKHAITGHTTPDDMTAAAPYIYQAHSPKQSLGRVPDSIVRSPTRTATDRARTGTVGRLEIRRVRRARARARSDFRQTAGPRFTAGHNRPEPTADRGGARWLRWRRAPGRPTPTDGVLVKITIDRDIAHVLVWPISLHRFRKSNIKYRLK